MKAMILAAGLGTRLLPLTEKTPKPLFPILGRPLIDILIRRLQAAGCRAVIINTHHLAPRIDEFINAQAYGIPVLTRHEPEILGTGGGIKNVEDFWDEDPFMVVNGDILTDIDLEGVCSFHRGHKDPVTLVLHDCPQYNHVWLDPKNRVKGFGHSQPCPPKDADSERADHAAFHKVAYTGIQVLDPVVLDFIPQGTFCNIIDAFCDMLRKGLTIRGFVARDHYWHDIGTMEGYGEASRDAVARKALGCHRPAAKPGPLTWSKLKGDGSDRTWYRVAVQGRRTGPGGSAPVSSTGKALRGDEGASIILVDHGPPPGPEVCEADAFARIGKHLHERGVPVPRIHVYDRPSGLVALEDLGDVHLQDVVRRADDRGEVASHYRAVIDRLVHMAVEGAKGFDLRCTYQTPHYDQELILDGEARYFMEAFVRDYLGRETDFESLRPDFEALASRALEHPFKGFLHRDFQSRNILVKDGGYFFIDFQGGRLGPLQYDLASLLIDPYVALPQGLQETLLDYYIEKLSGSMAIDRDLFVDGYNCCALNRNLQILGAFAFLSRQKGKTDFEAYIPAALSSLKARLDNLPTGACPRLRGLVEGL